MIREDARQIIASWLASSKGKKDQCGYIEGWFYERDAEAFRMAIEALEQEPCEDAVSRAWLLDKIHAYAEADTTSTGESIGADYCAEFVEEAPNVMPKRGEWIVHSLMDEGHVELECPICRDTFIRAVDYKPHFCENCGARMEREKLDCELLREVCYILKELKESGKE